MTEKFKEIFGDRFKEGELLSKHLVFRVGGPAKWFAEARSVEEIKSAIDICHEENIDWMILGGGSNAIASDEGYDGLVIKIGMKGIEIDGLIVAVDAGMPSVALARQVADKGLTGLEWMVSLPGLVGGAIRGNAGCFENETKDNIKTVTVLRDGEVIDVNLQDLEFGYRYSSFKDEENKDIILKAVFELKEDESAIIKERMHLILDKRKSTQPLASGTAGCTFKNPSVESIKELKDATHESQIPEEKLNGHNISAGWLIDQLDLKGTKIGGAYISKDHANFIVNDGTATADDIIKLVSLIKAKVRNNFGIQLEEEIQYIGF